MVESCVSMNGLNFGFGGDDDEDGGVYALIA